MFEQPKFGWQGRKDRRRPIQQDDAEGRRKIRTFIGSWVNEKRRGNGRALKTRPRKLKESVSRLEQPPMIQRGRSEECQCKMRWGTNCSGSDNAAPDAE